METQSKNRLASAINHVAQKLYLKSSKQNQSNIQFSLTVNLKDIYIFFFINLTML
jgi:hypothetical protein